MSSISRLARPSRRLGGSADGVLQPQVQRARGRVRLVVGRAATVLAFLLVWFVLVTPNQLSGLTPGAFLRDSDRGAGHRCHLPAVPTRGRTAVAAVVGALLGLLAIAKVLDMGFYAELERPFNPVSDWGYLRPAAGVLRDPSARAGHWPSRSVPSLLGAALLVLLPLAVYV